VPEIARFYGIVIRMFPEPGAPHHRLHLHAYYRVGIYAVDVVEPLGGALPVTQTRLVEAWAELHQAELLENWERLQDGRRPFKLAPLR
jgi:hypothetical protein